jgi:CubicO group peptidase (beta-lactamase class C family)
LGWSVGASYKGRVYGELLPRPGYFNHGGFGGVEMWVDPARDLIGVYFSVALDVDSRDFSIQDADLYMNMVTAGVINNGSSGATRPISWSESKLSEEGKPLTSIGRRLQEGRDIGLRPGTPEEVGADPERVRKVVDLANGWVESDMHPSLAVVAARHGVVFLNETIGHAGPEEDAPLLKANTLFPLMSLTKPITATAVMILVEEGLISLNRPVLDYIPEFQGERQDQVLIRHLLTHTSGFDNADLAELAKSRGILKSSEPSQQNLAKLYNVYDEYMGLIYELPSLKKPDQTMIYSDLNYDLLAEVIARVSGSTFPEFVRQRIFEPLGMKDSVMPVNEVTKKRVVRRPVNAPNDELITAVLDSRVPTGAAGGFSSAIDMTVFGQMFLNSGTLGGERILSTASVEAMTRDQIPGILAEDKGETIGPAEWGLGWSIHIDSKSWVYGEHLLSQGSYCHGGSGGVFFWIDPVRDLVAVFFSTYLSMTKDERPVIAIDLFINSVLASIIDDYPAF